MRITHHVSRACVVALSIFNDFGEHASRFTLHASRVCRVVALGCYYKLGRNWWCDNDVRRLKIWIHYQHSRNNMSNAAHAMCIRSKENVKLFKNMSFYHIVYLNLICSLYMYIILMFYVSCVTIYIFFYGRVFFLSGYFISRGFTSQCE